MSGKRSRDKGLNFERVVANDLKDIFPDAARQLEFQVDQAKGVDIRGTGRFKIQCKNKKSYVSVNTINEVKCDLFEVPILVTKANRLPAMAVIPWKDLLVLLKRS